MVPLRQELRIATRTMRRAPLFAVTMVATIALAIGANTAVFTVTNAVLLNPLPFHAPERLVWIASITRDQPNFPFSLPELLDYREQARRLDALVAFASWNAIIAGTGPAERLQGIRISSNAFDVLGVRPAAGRLLRAEDDRREAPAVAVLGFDTWQRRYGGRDAAVGTVALLNGEPFEIVGVMPRYFPLPGNIEIAVPLAPDRDPVRAIRRSVNSLRFIGRLRGDATPQQAEEELRAIAARLRAQYPEAYATKIGVSAAPLHAYLVRNHARGLTLLTIAAGVALLVACGNLVNLLLVRAAARASAVRVRIALGASVFDIGRSLWIEVFQLAAIGAVLGVAVAWWLLAALTRFGPADIPRMKEIGLDWPALGFAGAVTFVVATVLALAPLHQIAASRIASTNASRDDDWSRRSARLRQAVIVAEMALTVVLLLASALLLRRFDQLQRVDPGFPVDDCAVARIALPRAAYRTPESVLRFAERFQQELHRIPGVSTAGGVNVAPLSNVLATVNFTVEGRPPADPREIPTAHYRVVTDGYFRALGVPLVRGRDFGERDTMTAVPVAVINRHLAKTFFKDEDPLGRRIRVDDTTGGYRFLDIVGVAGDVRQVTLDGPPTFDIYVPLRQVRTDVVQWLANNQFWVIKTFGSVGDLAAGTRRALEAADPTAGLAHVRPLEEYVDGALTPRRFATMIAGALATLSTALVIVGLYGVIGYSVAQRTREIGVRTAIGATRLGIWWLIAGSALRMLTAGAIAGLILFVPALQPLESVLFETGSFDVVLVAVVIAGLIAIGLGAATIPAWRAASIDAVTALRD